MNFRVSIGRSIYPRQFNINVILRLFHNNLHLTRCLLVPSLLHDNLYSNSESN
jgi:hypothetical protein